MLNLLLPLLLVCAQPPSVGHLCRPNTELDLLVGPTKPYQPQPGDIWLLSEPRLAWTILYTIALVPSRPAHAAMVVGLEDGSMGLLEAGYDTTPWTRITSIEQRFQEYKGSIWVRQRSTPLMAEQSQRLTEFARAAQDQRYALIRLIGQLTPLRSRGPLRTFVMGKPRGIGGRYQCVEIVMEACVYMGLLDAQTTRPAATYPRDVFFDRSSNIYINCHLNLHEAGWEIPARWTRCAIRCPAPCVCPCPSQNR